MSFPPGLSQQFEPIRMIGRGSYGEVYLARDRELDREVAVKLLRADVDPSALERFQREAEILGALRHPGIVTVYDHGVSDDRPYLVMEFVEGTTLDAAAPLDEPMEVMLQVADALDEIHRSGVVHRDVKPSNVLLAADGRAVLIDFGLMLDHRRRTLTKTGMVVGTPVYMAPERMVGEPATPAGDWYSWGVTLYYAFEARHPFTSTDAMECASRGKAPEVRFQRLGEDRPEAGLIRRCMADRREERPQSRRAIEHRLAELSGVAPARVADAVPMGSTGVQAALETEEGGTGGLGRRLVLVWGVSLALLVGLWRSREEAPIPRPPSPIAEAAPAASRGGPPRVPDEMEPEGRNPEGYLRYRNPRDGALQVLVPGGEVPRRSVRVAPPREPVPEPVGAFLMDVHEVDDVRMQRFLEETGNPPPLLWENQASLDRAAVHGVDWVLARDYCQWAGGRLPRSIEWEWAAMGPEGFDFPWGNAPPTPERANYAHAESENTLFFASVQPVGSYPAGASPFGIQDMAGNVDEWILEESVDPESEALHPDPGDVRVSRGGSWGTTAEGLYSYLYDRYPLGTRDQSHGFRCVRELVRGE